MWIVSQGEFVKNFTSSITNWFSALYFFRGLMIFCPFFRHSSPQNNRDWLPREFGLKMSRFAPLINLIYQPHAFVNPPAWGNLSIVLLNSENWNSLLTDSLLTYQFGVRAPSRPQNGIIEGRDNPEGFIHGPTAKGDHRKPPNCLNDFQDLEKILISVHYQCHGTTYDNIATGGLCGS